MTAPKITLYTDVRCAMSHRVLITLRELNLPFEEKRLDVVAGDSHTPSYLSDINPRGQVPALVYDGVALGESATIVQFLIDAHPHNNHLAPTTGTVEAAMKRAGMGYFIDTWMVKVHELYVRALFSQDVGASEKAAEEIGEVIVREVERLLVDAAPFLGGSKTLTWAEAMVGPLAVRLVRMVEAGVIDGAATRDLEEKAPRFWGWVKAVQDHPTVRETFIWEPLLESTRMHQKMVRSGDKDGLVPGHSR